MRSERPTEIFQPCFRPHTILKRLAPGKIKSMSYGGELFAQIVESGFVPKTVLFGTRHFDAEAVQLRPLTCDA